MSKPDHIWKTTTGAYDQVIALTQVMINDGLKQLWDNSGFKELQKKENKFRKFGFSHQNTPYDRLANIVFGPPSIILEPDVADLSTVRYKLHITEGIVEALRGWEPISDEVMDQEPCPTSSTYIAHYVVKDWTVTVPIKLILALAKKGSAEYEEAQKRMIPNDHSVYRFLVDTTRAGWNDMEIDTGNWQEEDYMFDNSGARVPILEKKVGMPRDWQNEPETFKETFGKMIQNGFKKMWNQGLDQLGTIAKLNKSTTEATPKAQFPVKDVRFQTYPHFTNQRRDPHGIPDGDLNYFLYLETVGANNSPDSGTEDAVIRVSNGNWTEGQNYKQSSEKSKFGTYTLNRRCFLEGYFLPKLTNFNRILQLNVMEKKATADARFLHWYAKISYRVQLGHSLPEIQGEDEKYGWKEGLPTRSSEWLDAHVYQKYISAPKNALVWHCLDDEHNNKPHHDQKGSVEADVYARMVTINRVVIEPGTDTIKMDGITWAMFSYVIDPSLVEWNRKGGFSFKSEWEVKFQLRSAFDGGIAIEVNWNTPSMQILWQAEGKWGLKPFKEKLQDCYTKVTNNFEYLVNDIRNSLQGQERLILPSVGVYIFRNPLMNHKGDLVAEVEYNPVALDKDGNVKDTLNSNGKVVRQYVQKPVLESPPQVFHSCAHEEAEAEEEV